MQSTNEKPLMIMDGGTGRELERIGAPFKQPEWSALALIEEPDSVRTVHDNFINAGAEMIITNSYAVVPFHIGQEKFDQNGAALIRLSAKLAHEAAQAAENSVKVLGSIPPLFGSYNPDAFCPEKALAILTPLIIEQAPYIDIWIMETISSLEEGHFVAKHLAKTGKPVWAAFTLTDRANNEEIPTIRSENTVENAVMAARDWENCEAILFNCSQPEEMTPALKIAKQHAPAHFHLGAYANTFCNKTKKGHLANQDITALKDELTPARYSEFANEWRQMGANIIGGCCGIFPEHIKHLKENLT